MHEKTTQIIDEVKKAICGKDEVIRLILKSVLAGRRKNDDGAGFCQDHGHGLRPCAVYT